MHAMTPEEQRSAMFPTGTEGPLIRSYWTRASSLGLVLQVRPGSLGVRDTGQRRVFQAAFVCGETDPRCCQRAIRGFQPGSCVPKIRHFLPTFHFGRSPKAHGDVAIILQADTFGAIDFGGRLAQEGSPTFVQVQKIHDRFRPGFQPEWPPPFFRFCQLGPPGRSGLGNIASWLLAPRCSFAVNQSTLRRCSLSQRWERRVRLGIMWSLLPRLDNRGRMPFCGVLPSIASHPCPVAGRHHDHLCVFTTPLVRRAARAIK